VTELAQRDADEVRSLASLAFRELGDAAAGLYGFHRAIAERAFGATGPAALPARAVHDAISERAYTAMGGGFRLVGRLADAALGRRRVEDGRALSSGPRGALLVGALTGLIGDRLEREGSDLHQPLAARVGGRTVEPDAEELAAAYPAATPGLVVFVHGLMESEFAWRVGGRPDTYGSRLREDLGLTPVELRYNTGRHISENGLELADLLERLVPVWPVEVERIALVGHSMGGLVARSACHQAAERADAWVGRVRHVVSLGSPHLGAPLAQGVHWASAALHALPETRPLAGVLRRRSAGIRDLRQGSLVDADWRDRDPDALRAEACEEVPLLDGATHCFVAATITADPRHPVGRLIGDWLVLETSASGRSRTRRIPFETEHGLVLGGTHHIALLNHPAVYERLRDWLAE
jgi:pimeloyl-ACP methyl ester carboxylesterase